MVNSGQAAVGFGGLVLLAIVVGSLLYIFYSRTNAVEKNGYGSLIMLLVVSISIPVFWMVESNNQASANASLFGTAVQRGADLYATDCTYQCYGIQNGQIVDAAYNGYPMSYFHSVSDDQLALIISSGQYNPKATYQPPNKNVIPISDQYGGALQSNDIVYLQDFIRSTDSSYLKQNGYPNMNGLQFIAPYLQANNQTLYNQAVSYAQNGQFGTPVDMTSQKAITLYIANPGQNGAQCQSQTSCFTPINVKVKVGTKITWVNQSSVGHTVTAIAGQNTSSPQAAPQIFDSANGSASNLVQTGQSFVWTVTPAAYAFDSENHRVLYYCRIHPDMLGQLVIVQ